MKENVKMFKKRPWNWNLKIRFVSRHRTSDIVCPYKALLTQCTLFGFLYNLWKQICNKQAGTLTHLTSKFWQTILLKKLKESVEEQIWNLYHNRLWMVPGEILTCTVFWSYMLVSKDALNIKIAAVCVNNELPQWFDPINKARNTFTEMID